MKRINILIFTYKQQELIKRTLDSILCQKEFGLNHIIVSDDHSPDNTWSVLEGYKEQYPDTIEIYQNPENLGVYGNWNQMVKHKGEADIYYLMAGDDELCDGILEQVQRLVVKENVNCDEPVGLYFDWKYMKPTGEERIVSNKYVAKNNDTFGLKLRNRISNRSCFVTRGLMKEYKPVDLTQGISLAETLADMQYSILAKKNYYDSFVGSIYYAGIGVSKNLFKKDYYDESIKANKMIMKLFNLKGRDSYWELYRICFNELGSKPSFVKLCKTLWYYLLGVKYGPARKIGTELMDIYKLL